MFICNSCNTDETKNPFNNNISGDIFDTGLKITLVDKDLQDRLNPESPSYLGKSYCDGIKVFVLYNGKKLSLKDAWDEERKGTAIYREELEGILPPVRETTDYGIITENTLGYYYILADQSYYSAESNNIGYTYICYPDGKEDEIKVEIFVNETGTIHLKNKIWINDELVYSLSNDRDKTYYNPKNYPWLEPELDDDGKQIGHQFRPKNGTQLVVIIK